MMVVGSLFAGWLIAAMMKAAKAAVAADQFVRTTGRYQFIGPSQIGMG